MEEKFLTVTEAAAKLNVSTRTIQRYCKQGRLAHRWVSGPRHKELQIVSPIPLSLLPGGHKKTLAETFGYLTREVYQQDVDELRQELAEKDRRIVVLEQEIRILKQYVTDKSGAPSLEYTGAGMLSDVVKRISDLIEDYEKIRSAEKKLILKLARKVQEHEQYLTRVGKHPYQSRDTSGNNR